MTRVNMQREYPPATRPVKDRALYLAFAEEHDRCQVCLIPASQAGLRGLSTHHVIKFKRSDEPTNLLRCCGRCHDRLENIRGRGEEPLPLGVGIVLRFIADPETLDLERIKALLGRPLPVLLPPPGWVSEERFKWEGV